MKKILADMLLVFSVTALGACNQTTEPSYVLNDPNRDTPIYNEWVGQVTYEETPVVVREDQTAGGYEVSLPTDMASASRYVLTSLENTVYAQESDEFNELFNSLNFTYLSLYSIDFTTVINQVVTVSEKIQNAFTDVKVVVPTNQLVTVANEDLENKAYVEGQERVLLTLLMPVEIDGYTARNGEVAVHTLHTYALVPVYYEISYATSTDGVLSLIDGNKLKTAYQNIRITTSGSLVTGLAE